MQRTKKRDAHEALAAGPAASNQLLLKLRQKKELSEEEWRDLLALSQLSRMEAQHALNAGRNELAIEWANVALEGYNDQSRRHKKWSLASSNVTASRMSLRALMIKGLGAKNGDLLRDPRILERELFDELEFAGITLEESRERANRWRANPSQGYPLRDLRLMRGAKNTLRAFSRLDLSLFERRDEITGWMAIRDDLA